MGWGPPNVGWWLGGGWWFRREKNSPEAEQRSLTFTDYTAGERGAEQWRRGCLSGGSGWGLFLKGGRWEGMATSGIFPFFGNSALLEVAHWSGPMDILRWVAGWACLDSARGSPCALSTFHGPSPLPKNVLCIHLNTGWYLGEMAQPPKSSCPVPSPKVKSPVVRAYC